MRFAGCRVRQLLCLEMVIGSWTDVIRIGGQNQSIGTVDYLRLTLNSVIRVFLVVGLGHHFGRLQGRKRGGELSRARKRVGKTKTLAGFGTLSTFVCTKISHMSTASTLRPSHSISHCFEESLAGKPSPLQTRELYLAD